jgi:hypothetical protein
MNGVWVVLTTSSGGELNREFVTNGDNMSDGINAVVKQFMTTGLQAGDRIEINEGWSEED